jgi:hypothetical protein
MTQDHLPTSPSLRFQTVQRSENRRRLDNHVLPKSSSASGPGRSTRVWRPNGLMMIELATQHFHCANPISHDQIEAAPSPNPARTSATGEAIKIKASKKVAFRVAKELKEAV